MSSITRLPVRKCTLPDAPDADTFFPDEPTTAEGRAEVEEMARDLCAGCPLLTACRFGAAERGEKHGIWGGLAPWEVRNLRRNTLRRSHAARQREMAVAS